MGLNDSKFVAYKMTRSDSPSCQNVKFDPAISLLSGSVEWPINPRFWITRGTFIQVIDIFSRILNFLSQILKQRRSESQEPQIVLCFPKSAVEEFHGMTCPNGENPPEHECFLSAIQSIRRYCRARNKFAWLSISVGSQQAVMSFTFK